MTIEQIFRFIHSWNRWLLMAIAVISLIYFAWGWLQSHPWTKRGQTLLTIFSSLVGLQWVVGIILLIILGSMTGFGVRHYWEHLVVQTIALAIAHIHMSWRRKEFPDKTRYQRGFLLIVGVLLLIVIGIIVLPSGIQWQFTGI